MITNSTRIEPDSAFVQFEVSAGEGNVDFYETTYYVDGGIASTVSDHYNMYGMLILTISC